METNFSSLPLSSLFFFLSPSLLRFSSPTPKLSVTDEFSTYLRPAFTAERREREGRGGERRGKDRNSKGKKPLLEIRGDVGKERGKGQWKCKKKSFLFCLPCIAEFILWAENAINLKAPPLPFRFPSSFGLFVGGQRIKEKAKEGGRGGGAKWPSFPPSLASCPVPTVLNQV